MRNLARTISLAAAICAVRAHALCSSEITGSDVDAVASALQPHVAAVSGEGTRPLMVREGVVEQIGELQILKLLIGLRDGVTGRDNQLKVRDALRAVMRTIAGNAQALRDLATDERSALVAVIDREIALVSCDDVGKKEAPGAGGR